MQLNGLEAYGRGSRVGPIGSQRLRSDPCNREAATGSFAQQFAEESEGTKFRRLIPSPAKPKRITYDCTRTRRRTPPEAIKTLLTEKQAIEEQLKLLGYGHENGATMKRRGRPP